MKRVIFYVWATVITAGVLFASLPMAVVVLEAASQSATMQPDSSEEAAQMAAIRDKVAKNPVHVASVFVYDSRRKADAAAAQTYAGFADEYGIYGGFTAVDLARHPDFASEMVDASDGAVSLDELQKLQKDGTPFVVCIESTTDGHVVAHVIARVQDGELNMNPVEQLMKAALNLRSA